MIISDDFRPVSVRYRRPSQCASSLSKARQKPGVGTMTNLSPIRQTPSALAPSGRLGDGLEPPPAARLARLFSPELVREAQAVFSMRLHREISETEARAMLANLTGFIRLLAAAS
jgi:hypothetical protein